MDTYKALFILAMVLCVGCVWLGSALTGRRHDESRPLFLALLAVFIEFANTCIQLRNRDIMLRHPNLVHQASAAHPLEAHLFAGAVLLVAILVALAPYLRTLRQRLRLRRLKPVEWTKQ